MMNKNILDMLELYLDKDNAIRKAVFHAASNGNLKVLKSLYEAENSDDFGCLVHAMNYAARNGHFEVVKFLTENREAPEDALVEAADNGHLEIVKFLAQHLGISTPMSWSTRCLVIKAYRFAEDHGHTEVVKYLRAF